MVRPGGFTVHPRCERLIESLHRWRGRDDEWKHAIDGLRYSLTTYIFRRHVGASAKIAIGGRT